MTTEKQNTFKAPSDYLFFEDAVKRQFRYVYDENTKEFLNAVLATSKSREKLLRKDTGLCRAQLGSARSGGCEYAGQMIFQDEVPYLPERM